jgi:hypothetical protein
MAMQAPPPAKGMSALDYYNTLTSQGLRPYEAYNAVQASFGAPKTPQQQAEDAASAEQNSALAQTAGTIAGLIGTRYVMNKAGYWIDRLNGKPAPPDIIKAIKTNQAASVAGGANLPDVNTSFDSKVPDFEYGGKTTTIDTPAGKQTVPTTLANDEGFLSSVNWDAVGSGALSLLAAYQAYKSYQSGDKIGAGISGATALASGAAAANAAGAGFAGSQTMAGAAPYLGAVAGAYQGYKTAEMIGDSAAGGKRNRDGAIGGATSGALIGGSVGSFVPVVGTAIGAGIGAVVGGLAGATASWTGSKKGKAQFMRDNIRGVLKDGGILDENFQGTLADGTKYDFGKDGSTLKWKNIDKLSAENPDSWKATVPLTDALASAYGFVGQKASDISAWYAKGAVSNAANDPATAIKNAQYFAKQQGISYDLIKTKLDEAIADNRISKSQYDYYLGGAQQLTAGMPKAKTQGNSTAPISTRAPAPLPPSTPSTPIAQPSKKKSIRDILQSNMNKIG